MNGAAQRSSSGGKVARLASTAAKCGGRTIAMSEDRAEGHAANAAKT